MDDAMGVVLVSPQPQDVVVAWRRPLAGHLPLLVPPVGVSPLQTTGITVGKD